ncbi:hypothetical protein [Halomonas mongoliensis]|uniref:hypothetical protein n=1 Tax=Halomonas mongoliensis TaxID=321265 RepID=UPI00403A9C63
MTATADLIALLDDIGQRDDGLGWAARGHARRLKRPVRYLRTREDHLHALEGFSELVEALELLERDTARRLADLIIGAWQDAWRIDREGGAQ